MPSRVLPMGRVWFGPSLALLLLSGALAAAEGAPKPQDRGASQSTESQVGAPPTRARLVLQEGDVPPGGAGQPVDELNAAYVNGLGQVAFTGSLEDGSTGDHFASVDGTVVHLNSAVAGLDLDRIEVSIGLSNSGGFIISPSTDGADSVWTDQGLLAVGGTQALGMPPGVLSVSHSGATMLPDGTAYWRSTFDETGDGSIEGSMLYRSSDATAGQAEIVLRSDELVEGLPIARPFGVDALYDISDNGVHHIQFLLLETGNSTTDGHLWVDGAVVAAENGPAAGTERWSRFTRVAVNDSGDYLFGGITASPGTDGFVAYNGAIALRTGDPVDGLPFNGPPALLSLNNRGQALFADSPGSPFFACDASDLLSSTRRLSGNLDFDNDGTIDASLTDIVPQSTTSPASSLGRDGRIVLGGRLRFGLEQRDAVVVLEGLTCDLVINEVDYDQGAEDTEEFIEIYNGTGQAVNLEAYSIQLVDGDGGGSMVYTTLDLPNVDLPDRDYYVVCGDADAVPNCDLDLPTNTDWIQDGSPDAVALLHNGSVVDTVSYEGDTGTPYTEDSGVGLEDLPGSDFFSLSRVVDGADGDQNQINFSGRCNSPGEANFQTTSGCMLVPVELMSFSIE